MSYKLEVVDNTDNIIKGRSLNPLLNFLLENDATQFYINLNNSNINFNINDENIFTLNNNNIILNKKIIFNESIDNITINNCYIDSRINIKKFNNGYYNNEDIVFLQTNKKIPIQYLPDEYNICNIKFTSREHLKLDSGNLLIKKGNLLINNIDNNSNTSSVLHIKGDNQTTDNYINSTITLTNNFNNDTIKMFANYPLITIGDNINDELLINLRDKKDLNLYLNSNLWINKNVGIGTEPDSDNNFALRVDGNIEITGNIIKLIDSCNLSSNFDLKNYVKHKELEYLLNKSQLALINQSNIINLSNSINNINQSPFIKNTYSICLNNKQVNINYFEGSNINKNNELGNNRENKLTYPSLFVGSSSNLDLNGNEIILRGIVCDNDIAAYSDSNIKYDILPLKNSLKNLLKLEGIKYKRKDLTTNLEYIGLIAQNVEKYYPELVSIHNNVKILAYQNIVAIIIEAIKELYELVIKT